MRISTAQRLDLFCPPISRLTSSGSVRRAAVLFQSTSLSSCTACLRCAASCLSLTVYIFFRFLFVTVHRIRCTFYIYVAPLTPQHSYDRLPSAFVRMALRYSNPEKADFKPDAIFRGNYTQALIDPIPKIAHFVHTDVKELTWLDWAAVRGAIINLGVEEVHIWLPEKEELKGWIWNRVLEMPEVKLRRITMPKTIYGSAVDTPERQADVVRLKILYEEGGPSESSRAIAEVMLMCFQVYA